MTRSERDYAVKLLQDQRAHLASVGFATDRPDLYAWRERAITAALEDLCRPRFSINPFI